MKKTNIFLITAVLILILFTSCKNDPVVTPRTDIHLDSNAQAGRHLVDKDGKTLYFFSNDANGLSNCTGGCLTNWTPFSPDSIATTFGDGLSISDFARITLATGTRQTTYKGWPLYYYTPAGVAEAPGATGGEGIGNVWFAAKPNYSIMIANFQLTGADGINYLSTYAPGDGRTNYFTDGNGNTLYAYFRDSFLINKYTRPDLSNNPNWPMYETENITVPSTLDKSLFAVITTATGKKQLTYKGWPLYYYGPDNMVRGINKGITIPASRAVGSTWPVVVKDAAPAPTP